MSDEYSTTMSFLSHLTAANVQRVPSARFLCMRTIIDAARCGEIKWTPT